MRFSRVRFPCVFNRLRVFDFFQGQNGIVTADRKRNMDRAGRHGADHKKVYRLVYRQRKCRTAENPFGVLSRLVFGA